jgi:thiamine pyrophosphokinase
MDFKDYKTVIIADGSFPTHEIPLSYIKDAERIICCDGSAERTLLSGITPDAIVGDMDSLSADAASKYADRIYPDSDQETNDLTKAVKWCRSRSYNNIVITGATGKREDHTIGNISLLAEYINNVNVIMVTDTGIFVPLLRETTLPSFRGQQVSVFSIDTDTKVSSQGLKYPLEETRITNWWQATLNESLGDSFNLRFINGRLIVYLKFR